MTISRVELQGQITRAQDFTTIKHQEDSRGFIEQANIHQKTEQKVEVKARMRGSVLMPRMVEMDIIMEMAAEGGKSRKKRKSRQQVVTAALI